MPARYRHACSAPSMKGCAPSFNCSGSHSCCTLIRRRVRMPRLQGKNALVTGASSGIGQAIAIRFAEEGANVAINYRGDAGGAETTRAAAAKAGGKHVVIQADISREDEVKSMFAKTLDAFGSLDV